MRIREADLKDNDTLVHLVAMMITNEHALEIAREIVDDFYKDQLLSTHVIEINGQVIGYSVSKRNGFEGTNGLTEITFLGVLEKYRKQGIAKKLLLHVENKLLEDGIRKTYVKVNPDNVTATCFWVKLGYQFEARMKDFDYPSHDSYFMGKDLK